MRAAGRGLDGQRLLGQLRLDRTELHQRALPAQPERQRPARIRAGVVRRREVVGERLVAHVHHEYDVLRRAPATLNGAVFKSGHRISFIHHVSAHHVSVALAVVKASAYVARHSIPRNRASPEKTSPSNQSCGTWDGYALCSSATLSCICSSVSSTYSH